MFKLNAETRDINTSPAKIRESGKIPAVFYGAKEKSTPITIDKIEFKKALKTAGESTVIDLVTNDGTIGVLVHDIQVDPLRNEPVHVDFYAVEKNKPIMVSVPLVFEGESVAIKNLGCTLVKVLHEIEVEALPKDLPHEIIVDISVLKEVDSHIIVKDIALPNGVTVITKEAEVVVMASAAMKEEEEAPVAVDLSAIEVEKKGKKEEEGEAAAE